MAEVTIKRWKVRLSSPTVVDGIIVIGMVRSSSVHITDTFLRHTSLTLPKDSEISSLREALQ